MISQTRHQPYKAGQVKKVKKPEVAAKRSGVRERERAHADLFQKMQTCSAMTEHSYGSSRGTTTASLTDAKATLRR
jgi:hypothetical protein